MPTHRKHPDLVSPADLVPEMHRLSEELDHALGDLTERSHKWAEAENAYRMARAKSQLKASGELESQGFERPTVDEKRAYVDLQTPKERLEAHMQEALMNAAREAVRARRSQLSALQSAAAAVRAEIEMASMGPRGSQHGA